VLQRKQLRRDLATRRLNDGIYGTIAASAGGAPVGSAVLATDVRLALPDFSGQQMYQFGFLRVASVDYRVGSFNVNTGAFVSVAAAINAIASGADFEVHQKLSAPQMDSALDETILRMGAQRIEVGIPSVPGALFYDITTVGSPNFRVTSVLDAYYYADPSNSLNRDRRNFTQEAVVLTGSGVEFRAEYALAASMQLILDALVTYTLGAADAATINLPDEETVLWGAAARCYDTLIADSPGQETNLYEKRRKEAVMQFNRLATKQAPQIDKKLTFETPFDQGTR
jgi:hypothetical protein